MTRRWLRILACALALVTLGAGAPGVASAHLPDLIPDPPGEPYNDYETWDAANHRIVRFDGYIHNVGAGEVDLEGTDNQSGVMHEVTQHTFEPMADFTLAATLRYETNDGHNHWHLYHAARYSLWNEEGTAEVAPAAKVGFCMVDSEKMRADAPAAEHSAGCGQGQPGAASVHMGLTPGWRDVYWDGLPFQWIDISNVAPGDYLVRGEVDPDDYVEESDETNNSLLSAMTAFHVRGHLPTPQVVRLDGVTPVTLTADDQGDTLDPPTFRIEDPPEHGTLDQPAGEWFTGATLTYTPDPGEPQTDSFTFTARESGVDFPLSPPTAAVTLDPSATLPPPDDPGEPGGTDQTPDQPATPRAEHVTISGAPGEMYAGTSVALTATLVDSDSDRVSWSTTAGDIGPEGVFHAPSSPGTATVRATAAGGTFAEAVIRILPPPARPPLLTACARLAGVELDDALGRVCARRANGQLIVSAVPKRAGRLRVSVVRRSKIVRRCLWRVHAGRRYGCRFKVRGAAGQYVRVTLRRSNGTLLSRRLAVR